VFFNNTLTENKWFTKEQETYKMRAFRILRGFRNSGNINQLH